MNRIVILVITLTAVVSPVFAQDSVPKLVNYQGKLTNAAGEALSNGTYAVKFELFNKPSEQTGDTRIWGRQYNVVLVGGQFNVVLGAAGGTTVTPTPAVDDIGFAFTDPERYLQMTIVSGPGISSEQTLLPRQQILSTPYAINGVPTGTVMPYVGAQGAPAGWVYCNGETIGNAGSGAKYASEAARGLYRLLWNSIEPSLLMIQTSAGSITTRGASADADFDAGKRLRTPDLRGRVIAGHDTMGSATQSPNDVNLLTAKIGGINGDRLGDYGGSETHTLTLSEIPVHNHGSVTSAGTHHHISVGRDITTEGSPFGKSPDNYSRVPNWSTISDGKMYETSDDGEHTHNTRDAGQGGAHNNIQPSYILNYIIKL
jgi:microcystin-dependent protein